MKKMTETRSRSIDLENRLIDFAMMVRKLLNQLPIDKFSQNLQSQLIRSSTSSAFNYGEVQSAESKKDFIHKMGICLKELRETNIGLKFIERSDYPVSNTILSEVKRENNELISIFVKSINTARLNSMKSNK
jgi:four helix bundle protein